MPEFLSLEWVEALDELARTAPGLAGIFPEPVVLEQQVVGDDGVSSYHVVLGPGPARVLPGPAPAPHVTVIVTDDAARRIHAGRANAQRCLTEGSLRLRGDPEVLVRFAEVVARVGDLFAAARR